MVSIKYSPRFLFSDVEIIELKEFFFVYITLAIQMSVCLSASRSVRLSVGLPVVRILDMHTCYAWETFGTGWSKNALKRGAASSFLIHGISHKTTTTTTATQHQQNAKWRVPVWIQHTIKTWGLHAQNTQSEDAAMMSAWNWNWMGNIRQTTHR